MANTTTSSSAVDGFFQELPILPPLFTLPGVDTNSGVSAALDSKLVSDDVALARVLQLYLPPATVEPARTIHHLARLALEPDVLAHAVDAEVNRPTLKPFNTFGNENKFDPLWTTAGWKAIKRIGHEQGLVSVSYEDTRKDYNRRVHQFGLGHVWVCTGTMTGCPMSMTDGAAKLLRNHLDDQDGNQPGLKRVVQETYRRLISRDPSEAWTTGQWMTERSGGSDVSGTETVARRLSQMHGAQNEHDAHGLPLGPWEINGFKWFSSATDSDMALMLARTDAGLGLFMAPMRRTVQDKSQRTDGRILTELNGIRIQRLKDKIGTKSLPTAELELKGVRAWLIGREGQGVREISTILNLTRLHTAAGAVGYWSRGLQVSRAYAKIRGIRGGLLQDNPQHLRWMADNTVKYTAAVHFSFFGHAMLGATEQDWDLVVKPTNAALLVPKDKAELASLFRLLTPVIKAQVSIASVIGLREHMESLGGVGYCENNEDGGLLNIAKIYRDNLVSPIWEGTVSVMAEDVVRVLADKRMNNGRTIQTVVAPWAEKIQAGYRGKFPEEALLVTNKIHALVAMEKTCDKEELLYRGRELLQHLEYIVCSVLLLHDAFTDDDEVSVEIAKRWVLSWAEQTPAKERHWKHECAMDRRIFLGLHARESTRTSGRL